MPAEAGKQPQGSVKKYLDKDGGYDMPEQRHEKTAAKAGATASSSGYVRPRPKHRPASLVQTIVLEHGTLEIFTRFTAKDPAADSQAVDAHMAQPVTAGPDPAEKATSKVPMQPPFPPPCPPPPPSPEKPIPPPPSTPHPDTLKKVAQQMLELKETLEQ